MQKQDYTDQHHAFIEQFGLQFEQGGLPRMAGRIFGLLLISNPPALTPNEMMAILDASSSSISSMMRILLQLQLVEQTSVPGERSRRYRIQPEGWSKLMMDRMMGVLQVRAILEQGKALLAGEEEQLAERVEEMDRFYAFMQRELEQMVARWKAMHGEE
jgi:DNA-binding transcriptional regulator GbsR (MarR family)